MFHLTSSMIPSSTDLYFVTRIAILVDSVDACLERDDFADDHVAFLNAFSDDGQTVVSYGIIVSVLRDRILGRLEEALFLKLCLVLPLFLFRGLVCRSCEQPSI